MVKKHKAKKPVISDSPHTAKTPSYLGSPNLENSHIAWRFSAADQGGKFTCGDFEHDDFKLLWDRLRAFEKMDVTQMKKAGSYHSVPTPNVAKTAKERLQLIKLDDVDVLHSFHIDGPCRLWCMKHDNIFSVLWWDRHHDVYPVAKKHT